jgi:deazaflavin-dependent oxidoreductase (nitroreductase family)
MSPMPIPDAVARLNRAATNHVTKPFAGRLPGLAVVHHAGRNSGRPYTTPVVVFERAGGYVIALPYGPDRDWVKNVVAAGGCDVKIRGALRPAGEPKVVHDPARPGIPAGVRQILAVLSVSHFLHLTKR